VRRARIIQRLILAAYLTVTLSAFLYTMTRWSPLPWSVIALSYGMMAPYQGVPPENARLVAEQRRAGGDWEDLDLGPYYPMQHGETIIRQHIPFLRWRTATGAPQDMENLRLAYEQLAWQILAREQQRDPSLVAVRLWWDRWPLSERGFEVRHTPEETLHSHIVTVPEL
jgi:hypothetical protein